MATYSESGEMSFDYSQLKDRSYKAHDYKVNPAIAKGPVQDRRCTDVLFCLLFNFVIGVMLYWCIDGYINGNPDMLLAPISGNNQICGFSEGVTDYPYLYIPDITEAITSGSSFFDYGVCVNECPTSSTSTYSCAGENPNYYDEACDDT